MVRPHSAPSRLALGKIGVARAGALALDEAAGEARGEGDGVRGVLGVEPEELRRRRRAAQDAVDGMKSRAYRHCTS
jgi:hypothetical protein